MKCKYEGCEREGDTECELPSYIEGEEDVVYHYCGEHAKEEGFCPCCGHFILGTGEEYHHNGICDTCWHNNFADEFETEDEDYYDEPY